MANKTITLLLSLLLAACGQPVSEDNHGYGWHYDEASSTTGIRVRHYQFPEPININEIDRMFVEVQRCIGATARGPLIIWVAGTDLPKNQFGEQILGETFVDTGMMRLDDSLQWFPVIAERHLKHEFVHWVLWASGFDTDVASHLAHTSPFFNFCI